MQQKKISCEKLVKMIVNQKQIISKNDSTLKINKKYK